MDPRDNSESFRKNSEINCEGKSNRNSKGTPKPSDHGDDVFTPMSNQSESNSVPLNGTLLGYLNSLPSNDNNQQSLKLSENSTDSLKNSSSASHSQMCNKINSNHFDQPEPSSSNRPEACDKGLDTEPQSCQRHRVCLDKAVNKYNGPSTSGTNKSCDNFDNCTVKENRKRPSSLRLNRHHFVDEDSSSDTGNDDYSLGSEDGCIYTYRGGEHLADLPSSFFSLDMGLPLDKHLPLPPNYVVRPEGAANNREQRSRASSPDMDFLEMDFDPGPSCDADTGEDSSPDIDLEDINEIPEENFAVAPPREVSPEGALAAVKGKSPTLGPVPGPSKAEHQYYDLPSISGAALGNEAEASASTSTSQDNGPYITHVNVRGERLLVKRTMAERMPVASVSQHVSSGDLVSPRELLNHEEELPDAQFSHQINQGERPTFDPINLSATLYHLNMAKRLMREKTAADVERHIDNDLNFVFEPPEVSEPSGVTAVPRSMVWSEREATERQVTQIATSACGATAVVNVFIALGVPVNVERINAAVGTRQRANHAPLPRYLLSRAVAGCTAADLVSGIQKASDGSVTARFFPTYPERVVSLSHWLADWISLGAIPILTLNLQVGCEGEIPDAWHHQMVFGVSRTGVYLCNPVERVAEAALWPRLASPSVLLVRTRDVLSRFTPRTDLTPLMAVPDRRFYTANVLGQVVNVIREWRATGWSESGIRTRHIRLPCAYQAGVTIAALTGSEAHRRLMHATNLPLLGDTASGWQ